MDVKVKILTETEGEKTVFEAPCVRVFPPGGVGIRYPIGGDTGTLEIFGDRLLMRRFGSSGLSAEFSAGQNSFFTMECGGAAAKIPLFTETYSVGRFLDGLSVTLVYVLDFGKVLQKFRLSVLIQGISEDI